MRLKGHCSGCLIPINEGNAYKQKNGSIMLCCKDCHGERSRRAMNAYRTGLSSDEYDEVMDRGGRKCEICGAKNCGVEKGRHGRVRGVLCLMCRNAVAYYRDSDLMARVAAYCER